MSFGIMQESNGSDDDSDDSESEYTIGVPTHPRHAISWQTNGVQVSMIFF